MGVVVRLAALCAGIIGAVGVFSATAGAATPAVHGDAFMSGRVPSGLIPATAQQLSRDPALDKIANDIVGASDFVVASEDDAAEWATFFPAGIDATNVLGFVILGDPQFFHVIFLAPDVSSVFGTWLTTKSTVGVEYPFAVAAMSLVHEAFHWKLMSGDESTVNACALKYLPSLLQTEFGVPETIAQTITTQVPATTTVRQPVTTYKWVTKHVKVHGKWTTKRVKVKTTTYKDVTTTTYEPQTTTSEVPNPEFQAIVDDASDFYAHQPPPYNAGVCSV